MIAHVGGLPLEETLPALLPARVRSRSPPAPRSPGRASSSGAADPQRTSKASLDAAERIGDRHTVRIRWCLPACARLSYANVMATVAGRGSPAATSKDARTGADIKNLAGKDVRNNWLPARM